mmetsp:Transcript_20273/g.77848  ORF Transcript_20273/g.77848 Transcript_20273/m.77848 type:complete len:218 (-) Transcript_20273:184-837(-)
MPPVRDQLTRHTGASKVRTVLGLHSPPTERCSHTMTRPSSEQEASWLASSPVAGAHATSLTQRECPLRSPFVSSTQAPSAPVRAHTRTLPSHPAVASRSVVFPASSAPRCVLGAHVTARVPSVLSLRGSLSSQAPPTDLVATRMLPSLEAQARVSPPASCGAHATLLTLESALIVCSATHAPGVDSRHTMALRSYPHEASTVPNLGCAQDTSHTGPS